MQTRQLVDMGFAEQDVADALRESRNDLERALDHLVSLGVQRNGSENQMDLPAR